MDTVDYFVDLIIFLVKFAIFAAIALPILYLFSLC